MPDKKLIRKLEEIRGKGRNEWPVAAMWNSLLASFIFDHDSIASLIRELNRNSQLRSVCGFQPHFYTGKDGVAKLILAPGASAYTNFINNPRECREELREVNTKTVKWFGFRLHLIADAAYELPVDFTVTKASASEVMETPVCHAERNRANKRKDRQRFQI